MRPSIYHPFVGGQGTPILLYLPRGPILAHARPEEEIIELLSSTSKSTIVRINYRLAGKHHYPTPVHDVLAGYDWVKENMTPWGVRHGRHFSGQARIGVCGELIGGGLASMLALTECRMGQTHVAAAAVSNPVVDWVFPSDTPHPCTGKHYHNAEAPGTQLKRKGDMLRQSWFQSAQAEELLVMCLKKVRDKCFKTPAAYLDPFASPVLFFRTAGVGFPGQDPISISSDVQEPFEAGGRRKAYRSFPPLGSGICVPGMRISFGSASALRYQGEELAKLMRKSCIRQQVQNCSIQNDDGEHSSSVDTDATSDIAAVNAKAEEKISTALNSGEGFWCSLKSNAWHTDIALIGHWFHTVLQ